MTLVRMCLSTLRGGTDPKEKKTPLVNRSLSSEVSEKCKVFHSFSWPAPCRNQKDAHEATLQLALSDEALNPLRVCGFLLF